MPRKLPKWFKLSEVMIKNRFNGLWWINIGIGNMLSLKLFKVKCYKMCAFTYFSSILRFLLLKIKLYLPFLQVEHNKMLFNFCKRKGKEFSTRISACFTVYKIRRMLSQKSNLGIDYTWMNEWFWGLAALWLYWSIVLTLQDKTLDAITQVDPQLDLIPKVDP